MSVSERHCLIGLGVVDLRSIAISFGFGVCGGSTTAKVDAASPHCNARTGKKGKSIRLRRLLSFVRRARTLSPRTRARVWAGQLGRRDWLCGWCTVQASSKPPE